MQETGFDSAAPSYDADFSDTPFAGVLRDRFYEVAAGYFPKTGHLLDIGCGTGVDASFFSGAGYRVSGLDASAAMLEVAAARAVPGADFRRYSLPDGLPFADGTFDGVYSHLGAFNCIPVEKHPVAELSRVLKPGGMLVLSLMNKVYLLEILTWLMLLSPRRAMRRFGPEPVIVPAGEADIPVWYPRKKEICAIYAPGFVLAGYRAQAVMIPPAVLTNRLSPDSVLLRLLKKADRVGSRLPVLRMFGDHTLFVFRKKG